MQIQENVSLKSFNTFGIDCHARYLLSINSQEDLTSFIESGQHQNIRKLILGGGSNLLFTKDFDGFIFHNRVAGIQVVKETSEHIVIKAGAGENWHGLVEFCLDRDYAGIENLSLIPGLVGAAPIQNIGAYGAELKEVFESLSAVEIASGIIKNFNLEDCQFGYRDSVFKRDLKNKYVITSVTLRLNKNPVYNTSYGSLKAKLDELGWELSIQNISNAVCMIRRSKLPDPNEIGNAGSFFKNPVIDVRLADQIESEYPDVPRYQEQENNTKLAAGWLIEKCGWKGKRIGDAGVHDRQALVLVNHGEATGAEILSLANQIQESVLAKFNISLNTEVNIINSI